MTPTRALRALLITALLCACRGLPGGQPDGGGGDGGVLADLAHWDALVAELDQTRTLIPSQGAMDVTAAGAKLFWLQLPGFSPTLHSYDGRTGERINYAFSVGVGTDAYNYVASADLVVTAQRVGDKLEYRAYRADAPDQLEGSFQVPVPTIDVKWWAYAVDGRTVYYVDTQVTPELYRWTPGERAPTRLFALSEAGIQVGEFWDFGVTGDFALIIESGRLWRLQISARQSTWLGNRSQVNGPVSGDADGVLFPTVNAPLYYQLASGTSVDVEAGIAASPFRISATHAIAHLYRSEPVLLGHQVIYVGKLGLFAYDLDSGGVRPLLLEPNVETGGVRYVSPRITSDGLLFVVGLHDGGSRVALYQVDLTP